MTRCGWCQGEYTAEQAREVYTPTVITGPERPVFACEGCIRTHGLLPRGEHAAVGAATFIGHRDYAPTVAQQPPKLCTRCGQVVTAYTVRPAEDDHGPVEVIWCEDIEACNQARARSRSRSRLGMLLPRHPG